MSAPHTHKYTSYIYTTIHYKWPHHQFLPSALKHIKNTHIYTEQRSKLAFAQISDISRHPLGMHTIVIKVNWWLWSTHRTSVIMQLYMLRECSSNMCLWRANPCVLHYYINVMHPRSNHHTIQIGQHMAYTHMQLQSYHFRMVWCLRTRMILIAMAVTNLAREQAVYIQRYM